jgi:hypothetical protein
MVILCTSMHHKALVACPAHAKQSHWLVGAAGLLLLRVDTGTLAPRTVNEGRSSFIAGLQNGLGGLQGLKVLGLPLLTDL